MVQGDALGNPERWGHTCSFHINDVLIGHLRAVLFTGTQWAFISSLSLFCQGWYSQLLGICSAIETQLCLPQTRFLQECNWPVRRSGLLMLTSLGDHIQGTHPAHCTFSLALRTPPFLSPFINGGIVF